MTKPFDILQPKTRENCVVFASPHSGRAYSDAFLNRTELPWEIIRSSEDAFVAELFDAAPEHGSPLLAARAPRAFVDLNRGPDELDPALIEGVRRPSHNPRIASGLGVIPRVVANGRPIYRGKLTLDEAHERITSVWRPYHDQLRTLLDEALNQFGQAVLIDCHSMPRDALETIGPRSGALPDVVIGDRFGASAGTPLVEHIEAAFAASGLKVAKNMPFAGAFTCQHYGRPSRRIHAVQIEIDRSLYMDETRIEPNDNFDSFKALISNVVKDICAFGRNETLPVAAE